MKEEEKLDIRKLQKDFDILKIEVVQELKEEKKKKIKERETEH